jgi:hypothetical protein
LFSSTQLLTNNYDQGGFRLDHYFGNSDQLFARYATSSQHELDPLPINGSGVPGFPVANNITTNSATVSYVHLYSPENRIFPECVSGGFFHNGVKLPAAAFAATGFEVHFLAVATMKPELSRAN